MSLYENNLKAFVHHYPITSSRLLQISENNRFEVFQSPDDSLNVNIYDHEKGTIFYSEIPQHAILEQVDQYESKFGRYPVLFIYGISNGLFVKLLLQNTNHRFIIVIEPEPELLFVAFNLIDFSKEIEDRRVHFFLEDQIDFVRASGIFSDSQIKVFSKTYHLEPNIPYYENYYTNSLLRVNSVMTRAIEHVVTGLGNDSIDALSGLEWHLANVSKMVETPTLVELISKIKTTPTAVIVSTGPSLAKQISLLSQIKEHVTILSVDASLPILEQNGIKPDIVCSIERVPITAHFYRQTSPEFLNGIISVVSSISHPVLVDSLGDTTVQMNMRPFGYTRYFDLPDYGYVGIGMSAANLAYEIAYHARFKNIILIGQDLAFGSDGQSHSDGHVLHNIKHKDSDSFVLAYGGEGTVRTSMLWNMFRNFYETDIQSANEIGIVTINATEGGARIHGALELPFKDAIEHYVDQSISKHSILLEIPSDELIETRKCAVEDKIVKMSEYVTLMQRTVSTLFEKVAACTEQLDRIDAKKNLSKVDYDELAGLMGEIDEIKSKFDEPMFADIFIDATQALIVHQELELARIQVRPVQSDDDRRQKMIDWIYAHKTWLFSLAGIMEAERTVIERRGADAYILRDAHIVANRVTGYIVDLKNVSKTFDVEFVIDGEVVDDKVADQLLYHHLLDDPNPGRFNFEIPERFFDNHIHTIIVKDRESGMYLSSDLTPVILLKDMKTSGEVLRISNVSFEGWCKKVGSVEKQLIEIYIDDRLITKICADKLIKSNNYLWNHENYGFEYVIPEHYCNGYKHKISFVVNETILQSGTTEFILDESNVIEQRIANYIASCSLKKNYISDKYVKHMIGFFLLKENLEDEDFVQAIYDLYEQFPFISFKAFYFDDDLKTLASEKFAKMKNISYVIPSTIDDVMNEIEIYFSNYDRNFKIQIESQTVRAIRSFSNNTYAYGARLNFKDLSLADWEKQNEAYFKLFFENLENLGFSPNDPKKYGHTFHEVFLKKAIESYKLDLKFNMDMSVYDTGIQYLLKIGVQYHDFFNYLINFGKVYERLQNREK